MVHERSYDLRAKPGLATAPLAARNDRVRRNGRSLPPVSLPPAGAAGAGAWIEGLGVIGGVDANSGSSESDYRIGGLALGLDYRVHPNVAIGGAFGYANTDLDVSDLDSESRSDSYLAALYAAYGNDYLDLALSGRYGHHEIDTERQIAFASIARSATGSADANDYGLTADSAVQLFSLGAFRTQVLASTSYLHLVRDAFNENGAGDLSLHVDSETIDSIESGLGARVRARFETDPGWIFAPELWARWHHEFGDVDRDLDARLGPDPKLGHFTLSGAEPDRDSASIGARWTTTSPQDLRIVLAYSLRASQSLLDHAPSLGLQLVW
jgi:outer membrane autotransporter protein